MDQDLDAQPQDQSTGPSNTPPGEDGATASPEQSGRPESGTQQPDEFQTMLASLTEGGTPATGDAPGAAGRQRDAAGRFVSTAQTEQQQAQPPGAAPDQQAQPPQQAQQLPKTPEQEDAELLAGIQSERGRARVQQIIEARRQAESGLESIREVVASAGMTAESFSQHIEFARLSNSNDPRELQAAAQMLEEVRADIYRRLGQDGPALDVLSAHPDLQQKVANLELPRDVALEVVRMRNQAAHENTLRQQQMAQVQAQRQQDEQSQQVQRDLQAAQQSLNAYVATRQHEVDHPARMAAVKEYFSKPENLQEFARTYQPNQWTAAIRMLYDNVRIAPAQQRGPAPISSRPAVAGRASLPANASGDVQIMRMIENMGLVS